MATVAEFGEQVGMYELLQGLSAISTMVILAAAAVHLATFFVLVLWYRRDLRQIVASLDDFTRGLKHRSVLGRNSHLSDQITAFLADVNEVLGHPSRKADRTLLLNRMQIIDERRNYINSLFFETSYNIWRTMIEAYPLAGVMGTILAIGAALGGEASSALSEIVARFGDAIWSTFAGLTSAIVLMFLNSLVEPPFGRLVESREHVRDTIARAKRELALTSEETA